MSEQLQRRRPVTVDGTGTGEDEQVKVDPGSTDEMQRSLTEAADRLAKKKVDDALEAARKAAQEQERKVKRRAPCCCCC